MEKDMRFKKKQIREWDGFQTLLPRSCGHRAFYIRVDEKKSFRVYKVKHLFSTVGVAWIIEFYVSYRDLNRTRRHPYKSTDRSFGLDCPPDDGIRIIDSLKKYGKCDLRKYFCE